MLLQTFACLPVLAVADLAVAAGPSTTAVASAVKLEHQQQDVVAQMPLPEERQQAHTLRLASFEMGRVLEQGTPLLASGGEEYDVAPPGASRAEALAAQRVALKQRLGLSGAMGSIMDTDDIFRRATLAAGVAARWAVTCVKPTCCQ